MINKPSKLLMFYEVCFVLNRLFYIKINYETTMEVGWNEITMQNSNWR